MPWEGMGVPGGLGCWLDTGHRMEKVFIWCFLCLADQPWVFTSAFPSVSLDDANEGCGPCLLISCMQCRDSFSREQSRARTAHFLVPALCNVRWPILQMVQLRP